MSQARVVIEQDFGVPPETLWAAITDHEGMGKWLPARVSLIAGSSGGRRDGGVGTVRRMRTNGIVIDEEVVYADPPEGERPGRLVYRVVRGIPVRFHRGEMIVERGASAARSRLSWDIVIASAIPGFARATAVALRPALSRGLRTLDGLISTATS